MADGMKRRDFLKVVGAGGVGVAAAGCSTGQADKLIPYVIQPEEIVPGVPTWYATTCRECPAGCGLMVETHEGRATKVEGTPDHPVSHGHTCARGQASVQGLYHPDRHRGPSVVEEGVGVPRNLSWSGVETDLARRIQGFRQAGRAGEIVFITGGYTGTMDRLARDFTAAVGARRVEYAPLEDAPRDLDFADADLLISFGADFLETWGSPVDYAHQFARMHAYRRDAGGAARRGRFVWVGPHRPLTGLSADLWIAPRPGTEGRIAALLAGGGGDAAAVAQATGVPPQKLQTLVEWYGQSARRVALGPGAALSGTNATAVRQAVARINGAGAAPAAGGTDLRALRQVIEEMRAGRVGMVFIDAPDPAHTLPGGMRFVEALKRVPVRVSFSPFPDETSRHCNYLLPDHHFLEKWDDYEPRPGVSALVQPVMRPVFNTRQVGDVLLALARQLGVALPGAADSYYDYLRAGWAGRASGTAWREAVKRGGVWGGAAVAAAPPPVQGDTTTAATTPAAPQPPRPAGPVAYQDLSFAGEGEFHLVVYPSYRFFDGRTANRPWLLELPDPVTKVPWDAWVEIHPEAARRLEVEQGDELEVTSRHGSLRLRAYVWPGVRPDTVAIQMGLGHEGFGQWTEGRGANPMRLLGGDSDAATGAPAYFGEKVALRRTGETNTRWTGIFEQGVRVQHDRRLAQAVSLAAITRADAAGGGRIPGQDQEIEQLHGGGGFAPVPTHTDPTAFPAEGGKFGEYIDGEVRWGMAVDLARCIGCAACTVACYAENNIPVVGPSEVKRGRDLSWLRIERYFGVTREEDEALREEATDDVRFLPMLCQHCSNAPCEPVCPVYAAYHTPDGLNAQVYNRCVGTRYCANNCPWKVRVFNWFTYKFAEPLNWQLNPDVTVREKGVMEKCTFCVQRIHERERGAAQEGRLLRDGEVVPACVQACPTEVFVFGNFSDPASALSRVAASHRGYRTLDEINAQPAIVYLKKVTLHEPANGGHGERPAPFGGDEHTPQGGVAQPAQQGGH